MVRSRQLLVAVAGGHPHCTPVVIYRAIHTPRRWHLGMVCALLGCSVEYTSKRKARRVGRWIVQANHPVRLRSNSQRTASRLDFTGHSLALVSPIPKPWADEGRIYAPLSITGVGNNTLVSPSAHRIEDGSVRAQQHPPLASSIRRVGRFKEDHLSHIHVIL